MRTIHLRSAAIAGATLLTLAGSVAAQEEPAGLLNGLEVRQLVARGEPADDTRLSAHFAALADRYMREARRHNAMAQAFISSPTRRVPANAAADHCKRLATLNEKSSETLRELAAYHGKRAAGTVTDPPKAGARFQSGAGAPAPTDAELTALAKKASTPADHLALEEYFNTAAKRYRGEADEHIAMAQAYRGTRVVQAAVHCDRLVTLARDEAKEATAAAEMHKQLATVAR